MAITSDDALKELINNPAKYVTKESLLGLAQKVSVEASGKVTLLYSGTFGIDAARNEISTGSVVNGLASQDIRTIDKTQAKIFLNSPIFIKAVADVYGTTVQDMELREPTTPEGKLANDFMNNSKTGVWAETSKRFIQGTTGELVTWTAHADPNRIFGATELPEALKEGSGITSINGRSTDILRKEVASVGYDKVLNGVNAASADAITASNMHLTTFNGSSTGTSGVAVDTGRFFSEWGINQGGIYLPNGESASQAMWKNATTETQKLWQQGKDLLEKVDDIPGAHLTGKALLRGAPLLGLALASVDAHAAYNNGDVEGAKRIMSDAAVETLGGIAGEAAVAAAVALGLTVFSVGAIPASIIGIAAAIVAGNLGSEAANRLMGYARQALADAGIDLGVGSPAPQPKSPQNPTILDNKVDPVNLNPSAPRPGDTTNNEATGAAGAGWRSDAAQQYINQGGISNTALGNIITGGTRPGNGSVGQTTDIMNALRAQASSVVDATRNAMGGNIMVAVSVPTVAAFTRLEHDITKSYTENGVLYKSDVFSAVVSYDAQGRAVGLTPTKDITLILKNANGDVGSALPTESLKGGVSYVPGTTSGNNAVGWGVTDLRVGVSGGTIQLFKVAKNVVFVDPLTLDGGNDGVQFSALPVNFDYDADGTTESLSWTAPTDPLLVMDVNGDGRINNGTELLDLTDSGKPLNLFTLDTAAQGGNNDKKLSAADAKFAHLKIWTDRNQDGYASDRELQSLSDLGIQSIDLNPNHIQSTVINGRLVRGMAATYTNGQTRTLWDVTLTPANTSTNPVTINQYSADIIKVISNGETALQSVSSTGVAINLNGSGATQAIGSLGNDTLTGTTGADWLIGGNGADKFDAGASNDLIVIDAEDYQADINGSAGIDTVLVADDRSVLLNLAQAQVEVVYGGYGDDVFIGGGADNYFIDSAAGDDLIIGGSADDVLSGADGEDVVHGGKGDDLIRGGRDNDQLLGGEGNDVLDGGLGNDTIKGESGNDVIIASGGSDTVDGGDGVDLIELEGSLEDYIFIKNNDSSFTIRDKKNIDGSNVDFQNGFISDRDGVQKVSNVERFSFKKGEQFTGVDFDITKPIPVNDQLEAADLNVISISFDQLLRNDLDFQNLSDPNLEIYWVGDAVGGSVSFDSTTKTVSFKPHSLNSYSALEFSYKVKDEQGNLAPIISNTNGASDEVKGRVTILPASAFGFKDPNYSKQWYLSATNVQQAWQYGYTGKSVSVLVLEPSGQFATNYQVANLNDEEFEGRVHEDFVDTTSHNVHATSVAGVIGAGKNNVGSIGVAYEVNINSIATSPHSSTKLKTDYRDRMSSMLDYDIVNNSYGSADYWATKNTISLTSASTVKDAALYGRNGLGSIVIFGAGNDRAKGHDAGLSMFTNNPYSIGVGSINKTTDLSTSGLNEPFSNRGANILISAPGSNIVTTGVQLTTSDGYTIGSPSTEVQGTSFAAPIISGVAALMLQANSSLSYRDIQTILALTARKDYSNAAQSDTVWSTNANYDWNGSGMHFSHDFGFGMVDAAAAVRMAETWLSEGSDFLNLQALTTTGVRSISDTGIGWWSFEIADSQSVEQAILNLQLNHTQWSDLRITLISPKGTQSILLDRPGVVGDQQFMNNPDGLTAFNHSLMSTHFRGESALGTWRLKIEDLSANGKASNYINASLNLISKVDNHLKRYILTDEYSGNKVFGAVDIDMTGELNASAVSSDASVNIDTGQGTFNGKTFTFGSGIDRLIGGGGNDSLTGSDQNETIIGGQGSDTINGGSGHDRLDGGAGDDVISGGFGQDILIGGFGNDTLTGGFDGDVFLIDNVIDDLNSTTITDFNASQGDVVIIRSPLQINFYQIYQHLEGGKLTLKFDIGNDKVGTVILENVSSTLSTRQLKTYGNEQDVNTDPITGAASANNVYVTPIWTVNKHDPTPIAMIAQDFSPVEGFLPIDQEFTDYKFFYYDELEAKVNPGQQIVIVFTEPKAVLLDTSFTSINEGPELNETNDMDQWVLKTGYTRYSILPKGVLSANWSGTKNLKSVITTAYSNSGEIKYDIGSIEWSTGTQENDILRLGSLSPMKPDKLSDYDWNFALKSLGLPYLSGLGGDDEVYGDSGREILDGGSGNDTLYGGSDNDVLVGSAGDDLIVGGRGDDLLIGDGGKIGTATFGGGSGNDEFIFNSGDGKDEILDYGPYADTIVFNNMQSDSDIVEDIEFSEVTRDSLRVNTLLKYGVPSSGDSVKFFTNVSISDFLDSTPLINHYQIRVGDHQTKICTHSGTEFTNKSDLVVQEKLSTKNLDLLSGSDAYYALYTNQVNVRAGEGNDSLFVFSGGNTIHGDAGDDRIELQNSISESVDYIYGDAGNDIIIGANVAAYIDGGADNDNITGSSKSDQLFGGDGDDSLYGGAGNDSLNGGTGTNRLFGGEGNDLLDGATSTLIAQSSSNSAAYLYGEQGNDTLNGSDQRDFLDGGADNDLLTGGAGDDVLLGGDGDDTLVGGSGDDLILSGSGADVIKLGMNSGRDFLDGLSGQDIVQIDGIVGNPNDFVLDKTNAFSKINFSWRDSTSNLTNSLNLSNYNWGTTFKFVAPNGNVSIKTLRQIFAENGYQVNEDFNYLDQYDTQLVGSFGTSGVLLGGENDDQLFGGPITSSVTENSELNGIRFNGNANYWYVVGRDGDDSIAGGYSGAIIDGGLGDDVIRGSNNVKVVSDTNFGGMDKIVLPEGITPEMLQYVRIQNPLEQAFMKLLKSNGVSYNYPGSIAEVIQSLNSADSLKLAQTLGQTSFGTRYLGDDRSTIEFTQLSGWPSIIGNPNTYSVPHFDTLRLQTTDGKFVLDIVGFYENGKFKNNIGNLVFSSAFDSSGQTLSFDLTALAKSKVKANRYSLDGGYFFQEYVVDRYGYPGRYVPAEVSIFDINPQLPSNSNSTKLEVKFDFDADTSVYVGANLSEVLYGTTSYYSQTSQVDLVTDKQRYSGSNNIYLKARSDVILGNDGDDTLYGGGSFIQFFSTDNSLFHQYSSAQLFGNYLFNIPNAYYADDWGYVTQRFDFNKSGEGLNYLRIYSGFMYDTLNGGDGNDKYIYRYGDGILKIKSIDIADAGAKGWDTLSLTDFKIEDVIIRPLENRYDGALNPRSYLDYLTGYYPSVGVPVWAGGLEIIVPVKYDNLGKPIYSYIQGNNNRSSEFGYISNGRIYVDSGINGQYHVDEITFKGGISLNVHEWIKEQISTVKPVVVNSSVYGINFYNTSISTVYGTFNYGEEYARKLKLVKPNLIGATPFSDLVNIDRNGFYAGFEGADQYVYQGLPNLAIIFWDKGDILTNLSFEYASNDYKFVGETLNQQSVMGKTKAEWIASGVLPYTSNSSSETFGTGLKNYSFELGNYVMLDSASLDIKNWHSLDDKQELANDVLITTISYGSNGQQIVDQQIILIGGALDIERRWFDLQSNQITQSFPYASEGDDYISIFDISSSAATIIDFDLERTIYTLGGNDTIDAFAEDIYVESENIYVGYRDKVYAGAGDDIVRSGAEDDTLYGGSGNDLLDGGYGDDLLVGGIGNDTLIGGQGIDILNGGSGNDVYYAEQSDIFFERPDDGNDTVITEGDFRLDSAGLENTENLTLIGSGEFAAFGNALNNIVKGNQADNVLNGLVGEDTLIGQGGGDTYYVDNDKDVVIETAENGYDQINSSVTYTLSANVEALLLTGIANINGSGNSENNRIMGNDANNILDGAGGDDTLIGGYGNDTYIVDSTSEEIVESKYGGVDTVISSISLTLGANLENLTLTGNSATDATGNALDNVLVGNDANNVLEGKMGNDTLVGGRGSDTYIVGQLLENWESYVGKEIPEDIVIENASFSTDIDVLKIGVDSTTLSWVKFYRSIERSGDDLVLLSHKEYDTDMGGADGIYKTVRIKNYFIGIEHQVEKIQFSDGLFKDIAQMLAEQGYQFNGTDQGDVMNGTDAVRLMFGGNGNDTINGGTGDNTIYGGDGDDFISGGAGNDELYGDAGSDTYIFSRGDGIDVIADGSHLEAGGGSSETQTIRINAYSSEVNLSRTGYVNPWDTKPPQNSDLIVVFKNSSTDRLTFKAWWSADSSNANRQIVFIDKTINLDEIELALTVKSTTAGADFIYGSGRNDTLFGGNGNDFLIGSAGADELYGEAGNDTLSGGVDNDKLYGGVGLDKLYGEDGQDSLYGGDGNDILDGGLGADYLDGGAGWNTYYVDNVGDTISGNGEIYSDLQTYKLADGQTNRVTINKGLNAVGNAESNAIVGNNYSNYIAGNAGEDYLYAGAEGFDVLQGGQGNDSLGRFVNDWYTGRTLGNALLDGGAGNDNLNSKDNGQIGQEFVNDILVGGKGDDIIYTAFHQEAWVDDGYEVPEYYGANGSDVILFNLGDGQDTLYVGDGSKLTLSIGQITSYDQLSLTKSESNLVLNIGTSDKITLSDWYANKSIANTKSVATLQVIAEHINGFSTDSTNNLRDNKIETFGFLDVVAAFDAAGALANWQLSEDRLSAHLKSGSNAEAIGGDIAYQYGLNGNLTNMGLNATQAVLSDANFGKVAQAFSSSTIGANEAIKLS